MRGESRVWPGLQNGNLRVSRECPLSAQLRWSGLPADEAIPVVENSRQIARSVAPSFSSASGRRFFGIETSVGIPPDRPSNSMKLTPLP